MYIMDNINDFKEQVLEQKSISTKKIYLNNYNTMIRLLNKPLVASTELEMIDTINNMDNKPSTKRQLMNFLIVYLNWFNDTSSLPKEEHFNVGIIKEARDAVWKMEEKSLTQRKKITLDKIPAKITQLKNYLKDVYEKEEWLKYIINYLLINYHVRNQDLNLMIVVGLHYHQLNPNDNYLNIKNNGVEYIRNNYKTHMIYGTKTYTIRDKKFINAVNQYIMYFKNKYPTMNSFPLLQRNLSRLQDDSIAKAIQRATFKNLTESQYNDVIVTSIKDFKDIGKLKKIGERRGTDIKTLIKYYNLNVPVEDI